MTTRAVLLQQLACEADHSWPPRAGVISDGESSDPYPIVEYMFDNQCKEADSAD